MFFTSSLSFGITCVLAAKKAKADRIVVLCKSLAGTGHGRMKARHRLADKIEYVDYDPIVAQEVLYREERKVRSIRDHQIARVPRLVYSNAIQSKWSTLVDEPLCTGGPANIGSGGDDGELKASEHNKNNNNIGETVAQLGIRLAAAGVPEPDLSSRYLVSQVLRQPRANDYLAFAGDSLSPAEQQELERLVHCRLARMPLQYIAGNWDFRTIRLTTRPPVFIPRPETEQLVDLVLEQLRTGGDRSVRILEIGPGSGNICLSILHETDNVTVTAVDRSRLAVELTRENAKQLGLDHRLKLLELRVTDKDMVTTANTVLETTNNDQEPFFDLMVSNPPYVLRKDLAAVAPEISLYEDLRALDGGADGLDVILPIIQLADKVLRPGGGILLEVDPCHPHLLPAHLHHLFADDRLRLERVVQDFRGKDRFVLIRKDT